MQPRSRSTNKQCTDIQHEPPQHHNLTSDSQSSTHAHTPLPLHDQIGVGDHASTHHKNSSRHNRPSGRPARGHLIKEASEGTHPEARAADSRVRKSNQPHFAPSDWLARKSRRSAMLTLRRRRNGDGTAMSIAPVVLDHSARWWWGCSVGLRSLTGNCAECVGTAGWLVLATPTPTPRGCVPTLPHQWSSPKGTIHTSHCGSQSRRQASRRSTALLSLCVILSTHPQGSGTLGRTGLRTRS
jgi:hypothetical protein